MCDFNLVIWCVNLACDLFTKRISCHKHTMKNFKSAWKKWPFKNNSLGFETAPYMLFKSTEAFSIMIYEGNVQDFV